MEKNFIIIVALIFLLVIPNFVFPTDTFDLSEKLVKIKNIVVFQFGDEGFGFYDYGANSFKIFDWKFNIINEVPLKRGEGPGEIKNDAAAGCLYKDQLLITPLGEKKIILYSQKGQYIRDLKLDIYPCRILNIKNSIYVLNGKINFSEDSPLIAKIINPESGITIDDIHFKKKLAAAKNETDIWLSGMMSFLDIDENNSLYILKGFEHMIFEVDGSGKCIWELNLPYMYKDKRWQEQVNGEMQNYISSLDFYLDMKVVKNTVFICFRKTIKQGKTPQENICQTYLIKVLKNGEQPKKIFDGTYCILGENKGVLYLFNHDDYKVLPVKLSEWD